jgi:hypothetical protein
MEIKTKIIRNSSLGMLAVIAVNLLVLFILGFPSMALLQIKKYLPLLVLLVVGFGIQIGLFTYLRHKNILCSATAITSGGVSSISMILCCSHYALNVLPFITPSIASFLSGYTFEIILLGIISNIFGIAFMVYKIKGVKK